MRHDISRVQAELNRRSDQNNAEESSSSSIHIKNVQLYSFSCIATVSGWSCMYVVE